MAAGMHLSGDGAGEFLAGLLMDRQRVHVGADGDGGAGPAALDGADHAGAADAGAVRDAQPRQFGGDDAGGAHLLEGQFGMRMDVAADRHQPRLDRRHRRRGCASPGR